MSKWNKDTFVQTIKSKCEPRISNIMVALINFTDSEADQVSWGRGEGYGTMTFKCKSADFGIIPLFHLTTDEVQPHQHLQKIYKRCRKFPRLI